MDIQFAKIEGRSSGYWAAVSILLLLVVAGLAATFLMIDQGLHLSGMNNRIPWGVQITMAVFYIGLSAGSLVVSGLYGVFGKLEYKPFARMAAFISSLIRSFRLIWTGGCRQADRKLSRLSRRADSVTVLWTHASFLFCGQLPFCVYGWWWVFRNAPDCASR